MLVNLVEIYEDSRIIKEAKTFGRKIEKQYLLREISINPAHLISAREELSLARTLIESQDGAKCSFPAGLDHRQKFTKLCLQRGNFGWDMIVIGDLNQIREKLNISSRKTLLNG
jgi:hypothetical protein